MSFICSFGNPERKRHTACYQLCRGRVWCPASRPRPRNCHCLHTDGPSGSSQRRWRLETKKRTMERGPGSSQLQFLRVLTFTVTVEFLLLTEELFVKLAVELHLQHLGEHQVAARFANFIRQQEFCRRPARQTRDVGDGDQKHLHISRDVSQLSRLGSVC